MDEELKPRKRNMVSEHFNGLVEKNGGTLETQTQRIDADGQRTVERTVRHVPAPKGKPVQVARSRPRPRGAGSDPLEREVWRLRRQRLIRRSQAPRTGALRVL